jgi:prepilin-type N-terminal cleavage/methylation domain-containing protein
MGVLKKRDQKGFTLIEIIAVLVILGILAAVAIPKYFDMQKVARQKAIDGALAALQSTATMDYGLGLLNGSVGYSATNGPTSKAASAVILGDYNGSYTGGASGVNITVFVDAGPTGWSADSPVKSKQFPMHQ